MPSNYSLCPPHPNTSILSEVSQSVHSSLDLLVNFAEITSTAPMQFEDLCNQREIFSPDIAEPKPAFSSTDPGEASTRMSSYTSSLLCAVTSLQRCRIFAIFSVSRISTALDRAGENFQGISNLLFSSSSLK